MKYFAHISSIQIFLGGNHPLENDDFLGTVKNT
jgi:hypothetical protein